MKGKLEGCRHIGEELHLLASENCTDYVSFSKGIIAMFLLGREFFIPNKFSSFVIIFLTVG